MKLQILVPQYKEDESVIKNLLDSLAIQQCVDFNDFEVIVCNDGSEVLLSNDFLKLYPFRIVYIAHSENKGISATRNTLMDVATADYIMYCDADDMFLNVFGIWKIFEDVKDGVEFYVPPFTEETRHPKTGKPYFVTHAEDGVFIHGKVYNLKWLRSEGIRWNETLKVHEDSYFNLLCYKVAKNRKIGEMIYYLWRWRDDSICRRDEQYLLKTYPYMVDSSDALVEEFSRRGMHEEARYYATYMMYDVYFLLNQEAWMEHREYRERLEERFGEFYARWKDLIREVEPEHEKNIIRETKGRAYKDGVYLEHITFGEWMRHIETEVMQK